MRRPVWRRAGVAAASIAAVVTLFIVVFDWNWLKGPLERAVTRATGRQLELGGDISGQWRLKPRLRFENVRFANPAWAKTPHLLTADRVELQIALLPLWAGRIHVLDLLLVKPTIALERTADGRATWLFDRTQSDPESAPRIDALGIDSGSLELADALNRAQLHVSFADDSHQTRPGSLQFTIKGSFRGENADLQGWSASLLEQRATHGSLPIFIRGTIAGTRIQLQGTTRSFPDLEQMDLRYRVQSTSLKRLAPVFAAPLPETPPYDVAGRLVRSGARWETQDMRGRVGSSDLSGTVFVTTGRSKPELEARLASKLLDLADLGPLIGAAPTGQSNADSARLLPTRSFDLSRVDALNAKVELTAQRILRAADFPFDNFRAEFTLKDSYITIVPLEFGMAGGSVQARVRMDARAPTLDTTINGRVRDLRVSKIFPAQAQLGEAAGLLAGFFDLRGKGNSIGSMLASGSGRATMLLTDGRVPNLLPALADLDGARIIKSMLGRHPEYVQCAAVDLSLERGLATPRVAVFETESTVLNLTGSIDLRDEGLALKLVQAPKKASFLSIRTPILITGSLRNPALAPDPGPLAGRTAAAVVLGLLNPLAALFATLEPGPGTDGACPEIRRSLPPQRATKVDAKTQGSGEPRGQHARFSQAGDAARNSEN